MLYRSWKEIPEAQKLLADCASNPPARMTRTDRFGDSWTLYSGRTYTALQKIWAAYSDELLAECDKAGDHKPFMIHAADTVDAAIDEALARRMRRAA